LKTSKYKVLLKEEKRERGEGKRGGKKGTATVL